MAKLIVGQNDLATVNPALAAEWHPMKNDLLPSQVTAGSNKKVWWKGPCGHEWKAEIMNRSRGCGCPYCANRHVKRGVNDFATVMPILAAEWHPIKNGGRKPDQFAYKSNEKVWWLGKCGHEWQATIASRTVGRGCPYCSGMKILPGYNDLMATNPRLAAEWDLEKNLNLLPTQVSPKSKKIVWWKGVCGHEWKASITARNIGRGCPLCSQRQKTK